MGSPLKKKCTTVAQLSLCVYMELIQYSNFICHLFESEKSSYKSDLLGLNTQ